MSNNVLQLIGSFNQGGSERQAVQLTRLLREKRAFNVFVATLDGSGPLREEVEALGITEIPEYRLTSFYDRNMLTQVRRFAHYLKDHKIDILHAHDFYTNIFGMAAGALARLPVRIASRRESSVRPLQQRWAEQTAFWLAHAVVANSEEIRRQVIAGGTPAAKVVTLHNGLDVARVTPSSAQREELLSALALPTGRRFITIVANFRAHFWKPTPVCLKDHPTFLHAAQRVRETIPEAAFVLAGEGNLLDDTRALAAQLGIAGDTFFIGRCQRVADLLAVSDVCVLSSQSEGFSNSILEYMAAARPVVATDVGGAREAVVEGETGYLVPAGDDKLISARIISLLRHPEKAREMGQRGREVVEKTFSCEAQLDSASRLYNRLLKLPPPPQNLQSVRRADVFQEEPKFVSPRQDQLLVESKTDLTTALQEKTK